MRVFDRNVVIARFYVNETGSARIVHTHNTQCSLLPPSLFRYFSYCSLFSSLCWCGSHCWSSFIFILLVKHLRISISTFFRVCVRLEDTSFQYAKERILNYMPFVIIANIFGDERNISFFQRWHMPNSVVLFSTPISVHFMTSFHFFFWIECDFWLPFFEGTFARECFTLIWIEQK